MTSIRFFTSKTRRLDEGAAALELLAHLRANRERLVISRLAIGAERALAIAGIGGLDALAA